jgi:hypothetical protein
MEKVTEFERRYMNMFLDNGIGMLPGSARSDYPNATEEEFVYIQMVHKRLAKFYDLYRDNSIGKLKEWE